MERSCTGDTLKYDIQTLEETHLITFMSRDEKINSTHTSPGGINLLT